MVRGVFFGSLLGLVIAVAGADVVQAQSVSDVVATVESVDAGSVPDPDSPLFGLRLAWMQVSQNTQLWLARSEERQAELEVQFAAREQLLMEKIESSDNPEALQTALERLQERQSRRLERLNQRIERIEGRRGGQAERLLERVQEIEERRFEASSAARLRIQEMHDDEASPAANRRIEREREETKDQIEGEREELRDRFERQREEIRRRMEERVDDHVDENEREEDEVEGERENEGEVEGVSVSWFVELANSLGL